MDRGYLKYLIEHKKQPRMRYWRKRRFDASLAEGHLLEKL
jgi:hypothetical protein